WVDASTYQLLFEVDNNIDRIYLVAPWVLDPFPPMRAFIDFAIQKGVKRFVLMSAAVLEVGGPLMGKVHEYLGTLNAEYCALRPSWFFDSLLMYYADHIREHDEIANAAGSGLIGWISTDIADVTFKALTDPVIDHTNPITVGPELLSYAQARRLITQMLTEVLGRKITHKQLSQEEYSKIMVQPEDYVAFMSLADAYISQGVEERAFNQANVVGMRRLRFYRGK
ncbi:hypothetical protein B0H19DRAFT_916884, partial [Mycena capillaripes]